VTSEQLSWQQVVGSVVQGSRSFEDDANLARVYAAATVRMDARYSSTGSQTCVARM